MTRERSEKSKYKHLSTGEYCTCAAYVAEIMCMRQAEFKGSGSLPYKFWNTAKWKWPFLRQTMVATELIKEFSEKALVRALDKISKKTFSLNGPNVKYKVRQEQELIDKEQQQERQKLELNEEQTFRKSSRTKKSLFNSLRDIDNGKKGSKE